MPPSPADSVLHLWVVESSYLSDNLTCTRLGPDRGIRRSLPSLYTVTRLSDTKERVFSKQQYLQQTKGHLPVEAIGNEARGISAPTRRTVWLGRSGG